MIKFAIFDVGQVCYPYSLSPLNDYFRNMVKDVACFDKKGGVKSFDYNPYMKGEVDFSTFCKDLCEHCQVRYIRGFERFIDKAMHDGVGEFFEETLSVMNGLRSRGVEVCLLSNALPNLADTAGCLVDRDRAFVSYEMGLLKPDKKIYENVLAQLGAEAKEVLFVDDKPKNVEAAKSVGMKAIVYNRKTIKNEIDRICNNRLPIECVNVKKCR